LRNFANLTRMRIQLALRNKMFFFFSVIFPLGMFFVYSGIFAKSHPRGVSFFLGPVIALNVMGSFWGLSAMLVMFREQGILRRFHVTPVSATDMLASSILANYVLTLPTVFIELLFARAIFHVNTFGDPISLLILVTVGTISFASLGLVVASVTNTMQETQVLNQLIWLPMIFLSGATLPMGYLPASAQNVSVFLPATYLVSGLQNAVFASFPVQRILIQLLSLAIWAALSFFVAAQLFRWEPEVKIPRRAKLWAAATILPFLFFGVWESQNREILDQAQKAFHSLDAPASTNQPPKTTAPSMETLPRSDKTARPQR
jgi:ABC-type multidrug transport system permease subunit